MDTLEKGDLKSFLRIRFSGPPEDEIELLAGLIDESLDLMQRHGYQWERVRGIMMDEFGASEGAEALKQLREHLAVYREFKNLK
ncbi:MAG TPA: hypothetical protein PKY31_07050 [Spirochaetota bacterium]|nr:hypothetical protein [Spirochaetota bacterium]